jgi:hypothetical protein
MIGVGIVISDRTKDSIPTPMTSTFMGTDIGAAGRQRRPCARTGTYSAPVRARFHTSSVESRARGGLF